MQNTVDQQMAKERAELTHRQITRLDAPEVRVRQTTGKATPLTASIDLSIRQSYQLVVTAS